MTRVKEGDFGERKMVDSKETKRCIELGSADGSPSDGPGEYSAKMLISPLWYSADGSPSDGPKEYSTRMLICPLWCSADGELPMKSRKERIRALQES